VTGRRDLRLVAAAVFVSAAGDLAALSALAVHLQRTTGSGVLVAALFAANWLALAAAAPWAGALVDRLDARKVLVGASIGQTGIALLLASTPGTTGVLALSALLGAGAALAVPAEFALVGAIAAAGNGAGRANTRVETARSLGYLLGPLAGTGMAAAEGVGAALLLDAVSFALVASAGSALRIRREPAPAAARGRARDGIALLAGDHVLRIATVVLVGSLLAMSTSISADAFFAAGLGHGSLGLGLLLTAWTAGMTVGSLATAPRIPPRLLAPAAVAAVGIQGAGKLGAATLGLLVPALGLYALGGAGHGVKNVAARTLIHERTPAAAHGRAFAAYAALRNGAELAALGAGGLLVDLAGGRETLILAGGSTVAIAALGLVALGRRASWPRLCNNYGASASSTVGTTLRSGRTPLISRARSAAGSVPSTTLNLWSP
jgi:hypothetical protein